MERTARIQRSLDGLTFDEFAANEDKIDAVMANLMIIGEAAGMIPEDIRVRYAAIPWTEMRRMRNRLIHGYARASIQIVWDTAQNDLPPIVPLLRQMLAEN